MTPNGKEKHYLWDEDEEEYEEAIVDYIESLDASISEPEKALRFSLVEDPIWQLRMVIPTEAIPPPLIPPGPGSQPAEPKCSYDEKPSKSTKPDVQELEKLARKALGDTIHRPKISTVQAGLLLLQYTDTDSAELTAQLISVAYGLGLHLDASNWNIRAGRKISRRPSKMIKKVQKGRILFSHMITLSEILADILDTVFPARITREIATAGANGLAIIQENVKPVQLRLKEWFQSFQTSLKPQHLFSLWYFASPQSFALVGVFGTLLLSIVSSLEDVEFYRRKLREYRWTLEINSENEARYMKPAMALLDANLGLLKEASQFEK
ncbi:transcription factor TamA [Drepanopeziza brunnea f. sp. 'multigermtubi' MB_m1]|uniref:Transcription factor TamA n=1 Tax=Marssonina brunnea f. sp. multigermtubi (strain MB_m1) TaxID=1072389 RepID=K1X7Y4_MARBU|nr:transcription factor TamA [Drepanopeziza brunnea f. sp. 'multigermtubi' MB_m1]EKD16758.1 transcription factor TamA [Drepanopeziza brunnea f. sp. 'multigermtubi' MB_m1]